MDHDTAVRVFNALEKPRYLYEDEAYPRMRVRLDADANVDEQRVFRLFVRRHPGAPFDDAQDDWRYVLDLVQEHGLSIEVENAGMALT